MLVPFGISHAVQYQVTPVAKVTHLLNRLIEQVQEEGAAEAAQYDKYACFCKEQANNKVYSIGKSDSEIAFLQASITDLDGKITVLDVAVADTKAKITTESLASVDKQKVRDTAVSSYTAGRAELVEAVDAVDQALAEVRATKQGVAETDAKLLEVAQRSIAKLNVWGLPTLDLLQASGPAAYNYSSDEIIGLLLELSRTFKAQLKQLDEDEAGKSHDFAMVEAARVNKIAAFQNEVDKKTESSAEKVATKSELDGQMTVEAAARQADQAFLDAMTTGCEDKAKLWDQRSKTRASELTALTEAKGLLSSAGTLYGTNTKLVGLQRSSLSFLQTRHRGANGVKQVVEFLAVHAKLLKTESLDELLAQLVSGQDHFVRVRQLINDLIQRLKDQATAEAGQKSVCDTDMKQAIERRDGQATKMEDASSKIEVTRAQILQLNSAVDGLSQEIAQAHKAVAEMTKLRGQETAQNARTITDSKEGKELLDKAIVILNKFYTPSFFQAPILDRAGNAVADLAPATFDVEYKGNVDASKGIIGMLEVIAADFDRTNTLTTTAEGEAQTAFDTEKANLDGEITRKKAEKEAKDGEITGKEADLTGLKIDLETAKTIHSQALEELEKLKPADRKSVV